MTERLPPRYPIYVPSKGRWQTARALTVRCLMREGVPFRLVCEAGERDEYAALVGDERVLVLPESGRGLFWARNWIKDHSVAEGAERHWQLDDNIVEFRRFYRNQRIPCDAGVALRVCEDFSDRYENVAVSGLNYQTFGVKATKPFVTNCHVYSCVAPETPILCADLVWREAGSLPVGQEVVAFDEEPSYRGQGVNARSYRLATIERNEYAEKPSYVVSTDIGVPVRASAEHPWLVLRPGPRRRGQKGKPLQATRLRWVESRDLRVGDQIAHLSRPWARDESHDGGWFAGLWDGEGSLTTHGLRRRSQLTIAQKGGPVMDRAARVLRERGYAVRVSAARDVHVLAVVGGFLEVLRFAGEFRPTRLLEKMPPLWEGRGVRRDQSYELATVTSVESVGVRPVASISTSTGTFVTGGYLTHNCSLINNAIPHRWRLAYNDDTDLCLQVLADGWCTVLINAFLANKMRTMAVAGGNTDDATGPINYRGDGRLRMARALERVWPYVVTTDRRFERPQHVVRSAWKKFDTPLRLKPGVDPKAMTADEYGLKLVEVRPVASDELRALL